ncbi:cyanoexosortase A [Leptolyngbya sp. FACHB-36]|uniref:cyanoexosortase A n=1 Tax=Leptolyngbya sp. FACHB-36 TaxID=2692808 RepID=UPI00167FEC6E|nr:cyanoexosortase A [Leptolyngbya sp. FACHB-36]MBD2022075.1 cyanoexosortase A [Leptolyngbya sp. FACHB-36]
MYWLQRLQEPKFWLLGIAAAIATLHLTLVDRISNAELFATSFLFWLAAGSLVWDKRHTLTLRSSATSSILGACLLGLVLLRSTSLPDSNFFLRAVPFVSMLGLCLLASGARKLRQYWKELLIFGLLTLHPALELLLQLLDLPTLTAKAATFLLWYSGVDVQRQGVFLQLPTGRVEVYGACSGLQSILQMLNISVLFLLMVPVRPLQRLWCISVAVLLGFVVNSARVSLMAILVAFSQKNAFDYWHSGDGSLIFSMIAVLLFGGFCWLAFLRSSRKHLDEGAQANG